MPPKKSDFIFQDADLIVLHKPAGVIVNDATSHHQLSLQAQMSTYLHLPPPPTTPTHADSSATDIFLERRGMIHRLDKNTSGLLIWAKNPHASAHLLQQFRLRQVDKTYLCLVHGLLTLKSGRISLPLARKKTQRQLMAVSAAGRPALTFFQVIEEFPHFNYDLFRQTLPPLPPLDQNHLKKRPLAKLYQGFSLLTVSPHTGRTHQIRAHLTHLHHPLVGDTAYLPHRKAKVDPLWCPRQFLHATSLTFTHPTSLERLTFTSPLPPDLHAVLQFLQKS